MALNACQFSPIGYVDGDVGGFPFFHAWMMPVKSALCRQSCSLNNLRQNLSASSLAKDPRWLYSLASRRSARHEKNSGEMPWYG